MSRMMSAKELLSGLADFNAMPILPLNWQTKDVSLVMEENRAGSA